MKIKEYISKTTKENFERIYLQGGNLLKTKFARIGSAFSYKLDMKNKRVEIYPEIKDNVSGKGKVSRKFKINKKEETKVEIPVLDIDNKKILETFLGCKECKITIFEDKILVEGLFNSLSEEETKSLVNQLEDSKVIDLVSKKSAFYITKNALDLYMKKVAGGFEEQISLEDIGFSTHVNQFSTPVSQSSVSTFEQCDLFSSHFTPQIKKKVKKDEPFIVSLLSLFSGIGAFEQALKDADIPYHVVNYCEVDRYAARAYSLMHNEPLEKNLGDIKKVDETKLPDFDIMTYGFPCQDLSSLGKQKGLIDEDGEKTRSGLFYDAMRIAKYKKPKFMIAENVRALVSKTFEVEFHNMLELLKDLGYNTYYKVLNSKNFGVPQSRNRVFLVSIREDVDTLDFEFPNPEPLECKATDLIESGCLDDNLYLEEKHLKYCNEFRLNKKHSSLDPDTLICMTTKQGTRSNSQNFFHDVLGIRMMTAREMFMFQGFDKSYGDLLLDNGFSMNQIGKMLGNSITVNVLVGILKNLFKKELNNKKVIPLYV